MKFRSREVIQPLFIDPSTIEAVAKLYGKIVSDDKTCIIWCRTDAGNDEIVPINHYIWRTRAGNVQWASLENFDKLYEQIA